MSDHANNDLRVKLVAIAKDEAAYLPEWIFHHLSCGFDSIDVYINRTTDNSEEVLSLINKQYPQVKFYHADWVDQCGGTVFNRMQFVVYAKAFYEASISGDYTHIAFLDIDEFWMHQAQISIHDFVSGFLKDDVIYLEWLIDLPDPAPFSPIGEYIQGNLSVLGKCIFPLSAKVHRFRLHTSTFENKQRTVLADNSEFRNDENVVQSLHPSLNSLKQSFIFHRANRSTFEYVSLTRRGRPSSSFAYKENRKGLTQQSEKYHQIRVFKDSRRQKEFNEFIKKCQLDAALQNAREFVRNRYSQAIEGLEGALKQNYKVMKSIFAHVSDPRVLNAFALHRKRISEINPDDADIHRDLAKDAIHHDVADAVRLIERAHELRPHGPKIIELKARYQAMLNARQSKNG
ncbi:glycosyltransferase family 2 protein [Ningiella sp. W23]|uniref:glycosyltransferase family 2 protein n=1 Tax=Ningiella sp. W23 TaxID=3023715 RepID=UPI0037565525